MGRYAGTIDWVTIILILCICVFGLFILLTMNTQLFLQQLFFMFVAATLAYLCSKIDAVFLWWAAPFAYVFGVLFLLMSYIGPVIRGAHRWIMVFGMQLQPSELSKPLFILAFSFFLTKYSPRKLAHIPLHLVLFALPFLIIFKQPDLGTSIVYSSTWLAMMLGAGLSVFVIVISTGLSIFSLPLFWNHLLPYQKQRIETFLNPSLDPKGAGYNALQAMIAVGSGQWFGRGLGLGTQSHLRFLPEFHTDFIIATLVEELGFIGGLLLLSLYAMLLMRIILPLFSHIHNPKLFIYSLGLFSMLLTQVFINTAMNMGIIPITGITLPFVSYGGSSLFSFAISFGFLWALQKEKYVGTNIAIGSSN